MPSLSPSSPSLSRRVRPSLLLLLTVFGPISMDLYLPALPALTAELGAVTSVAQLTVTACLIGLAAGQLIAGPLSDRFGRRGILLIGIAAYILTSVLCALSPSIELLILARLVQGLMRRCGNRHRHRGRPRRLRGQGPHPLLRPASPSSGFAAIVGPSSEGC